ncbi:MAG: hypothetical protein OSB02_09535 [Rhodospirillaceae bacterium]|jgi:hypothetical protein|nr:hypothetical protein [Rhodospirillaceae bacterium]
MAGSKSSRKMYTADFIKSDTEQAVFLDNPLMDDMMTSIIALGAEVWANRRRTRTIELLFEKEGTITRNMIEGYVLTEEEEAELRKERDAFIQLTYGHIARTGEDQTALDISAKDNPGKSSGVDPEDETTRSGDAGMRMGGGS